MKTKQGFTLIELLVVVLIIAILVAIALPQYRVAVLKSKAIPLLNIMRTVMTAEEEFILSGSNGGEPGGIIADLDGLVVDLSGYEKSCRANTNTNSYQLCYYTNGNTTFELSESNAFVVGYVNDANGDEILSMNMVSDSGYNRMLTSDWKPSVNWQDTTAKNLCEYPSAHPQARVAAAVCNSICKGSPVYEGRGGALQYKTCYFN